MPPGYLGAANGNDCNDSDASAWRSWHVFADSDGDKVGAGSAVDLCATETQPAGYALSGGDCAPDDAARWQMLAYGFRDADGDSYTVAQSGSLCSGAALPAGYATAAHGNDCNDGDASVFAGFTAFADSDGDGVGAGSAASLCTAGALPPGYSLSGSDCAPADAARWQMLAYGYRDADGDSYTVAQSGSLCSGAALPAGYATAAHGNDCNDGDAALLALARPLHRQRRRRRRRHAAPGELPRQRAPRRLVALRRRHRRPRPRQDHRPQRHRRPPRLVLSYFFGRDSGGTSLFMR